MDRGAQLGTAIIIPEIVILNKLSAVAVLMSEQC